MNKTFKIAIILIVFLVSIFFLFNKRAYQYILQTEGEVDISNETLFEEVNDEVNNRDSEMYKIIERDTVNATSALDLEN